MRVIYHEHRLISYSSLWQQSCRARDVEGPKPDMIALRLNASSLTEEEMRASSGWSKVNLSVMANRSWALNLITSTPEVLYDEVIFLSNWTNQCMWQRMSYS